MESVGTRITYLLTVQNVVDILSKDHAFNVMGNATMSGKGISPWCVIVSFCSSTVASFHMVTRKSCNKKFKNLIFQVYWYVQCFRKEVYWLFLKFKGILEEEKKTDFFLTFPNFYQNLKKVCGIKIIWFFFFFWFNILWCMCFKTVLIIFNAF